MNERCKIKETEYFYSQMINNVDNPEHFKLNLSAFLSATRSVLQYADEEAKIMTEGQKCFDTQMAKPILKFFKDKRDINIHNKHIQPKTNVTIKLTETLHISESLKIKVIFIPENCFLLRISIFCSVQFKNRLVQNQ